MTVCSTSQDRSFNHLLVLVFVFILSHIDAHLSGNVLRTTL